MTPKGGRKRQKETKVGEGNSKVGPGGGVAGKSRVRPKGRRKEQSEAKVSRRTTK